MKQIILIDSKSNIGKVIRLNVNSHIGIEPIARENATDCLELLTILPTIDLIVTPEMVGGEQTAKKLAHYIKANKLSTDLITLGTSTKQEVGTNIEDPKRWREIIEAIAHSLSLDIDLDEKQMLRNYLPIPIDYFLNTDFCCCDVFVRIKRGPDDYHYVKRITRKQEVDKNLLEQYRKKGVRYLHIEKENREELVNYISNQLVKKLESVQNKETAPEKKIGIMSNSYDIATTEIVDIGISPASVQLTESVIETLKHYSGQKEQLALFLKRLLNTSRSPLYWNCHICSTLSIEILSHIDVSQDIHDKFAYASFFHDIYLVENPNLSRITSEEDLEAANLKKNDKDLILNHAQLAANLILDYKEAPLGTDSLIRHHHGNIKGVGFNRTIAELPKLSRLFYLISQFSETFNKIKLASKQVQHSSILNILQEKNREPEMSEPLGFLKAILQKHKR